MEEDVAQEFLDISGPSTSHSDFIEKIHLDYDTKSVILDNSDVDYFESNEEEQILVNKFLDGEMNFSEYLENVGIVEGIDDYEVSSQSFEDLDKVLDSSEENVKSVSHHVERLRKGVRKQVQKLPPALKGLMGEANVRFARGEKEIARKICVEIIRQVPTASEPYLTLAGIYDEIGDQEKALEYSLLAAHLCSTDVYEWIHLAETSEKLGNIKQAITCFDKAINLDIYNLDLHKKRETLLESIGDKKTAIRGYFRLLTAMKPEHGEQVTNVARYVAELFYKENDIEKASGALDMAFEKCPNDITIELVNLQLELLIQLKQYSKCLDLMYVYCNLTLLSEDVGNDFKVLDCSVPFDTPIDILGKLAVVLIHLKAGDIAKKIIHPIIDLHPSETGDLYLDIIDAFFEECYYAEADELLSVLVNCESYSLPGVWLKYAENLKNLDRLEEAVQAFYMVLEQAPQHSEAKMTLASLLVELGRAPEAISALSQNEEYDTLDVGILYERCMLLKRDINRAQEFIMVCQILFSRHSMNIRNKDELASISIIQRYDRKRVVVRQVRKTRKEPEDDIGTPSFKNDTLGPSLEEEWDLFKFVCNLCMRLKMYNTFQRLTYTAQLSKIFYVYKYEIDTLSVIASYFNKDSHNGYNIIRTLVAKEPYNVRLWHLFNLIITKSDDSRHHRFIMRQLAQNCDHEALASLHGNNCLVSGTYKYAMHEYSSSYVKNPTPLGALLLGLTYLQMAAQKFTSKKHHLVVQALSIFCQYRNLRGADALQEVHYNLGRGFHHLGLFTQAIFHYNKVLELRDLGLAKTKPEIFDLSKEAAFNLHLIYMQSESYDMAKMYLVEYIVV